MRPIRLAKTATTMTTRIERERAVSSHRVVPDRRHLGNRAPAPLDGYYPGNIVVRLLLGGGSKQAEEGGVPGARDSLLSMHQSVCKRKPAPDLIRGGNRFASRKTRQMEPRFDSIETGKAPGA